MREQSLRIFARIPDRSPLVRPTRPRSELHALVSREDDEEEVTKVAVPMAVAEPGAVEHVEPEIVVRVDSEATHAIERAESISMAIEDTIIEILATSPAYGETIEAAYRRKERELAVLFASLTRIEAAALQRRLTAPRADDVLAQRFARLVVERRTRLLALLAETPRREARRR